MTLEDPSLVRVEATKGLVLGSYTGENAMDQAVQHAERLAMENDRIYYVKPIYGRSRKVEPPQI